MWKANVISIKKPVQLLTEVIIFQEITSLISVFSRQTSIKSCVGALLPKNYFVTLYVALYLICPLVNKLIMDLSEDQYRTWIAVLVLIFSVEPAAVDILEGLLGRSVMGISTIGVLGAQWGYTILTFLLVYIIAAYYGKYHIQWSMRKSLLVFFCTVSFLTIWKILELKVGRSIGAEHYQNPMVILAAIAVFMIFHNLKLESQVINRMSKGCFTVFLVHWSFVQILPVSNPNQMSMLNLMLTLICNTVIVFIISDCIGMCYSFIENMIFDFIGEKIGYYKLDIKASR